MQEIDLDDAKEAINKIASGFEDLVNICRSLPNRQKERLFNPVVFGPISAFLGLGNGYEGVNYQTINSETLLDIIEGEIEEDEMDEYNDDCENH